MFLAALEDDPVHDVRCRRDQVQSEFTFETFAGDLHVQQTEEAAAEPEAESDGRFRLVGERGVVELQLVEGIAQVRVVRAVHRVQARVDHRPRLAVAGERLDRTAARRGHGVTDLGLAHVLHAGDEIADLADAEPGRRLRLGRDDADLEQFVGRAGRHHLDLLARHDLAVDDADVGHHTAVGVVHRVEDHGPGRRVRIAYGRRYLTDHLVEQFRHAHAGLAGHPQHVAGLAADDVGDLRGVPIGGVGRGQVDLVEDRMIVRSLSSARYRFARVCASMPCAASTSSTAPSHASSARETS